MAKRNKVLFNKIFFSLCACNYYDIKVYFTTVGSCQVSLKTRFTAADV